MGSSLRRQLVHTVFIQGIGAAALLLAVVWIGVRQGPEAQGLFNRTKAEVEFVAAFAMFGMPQALFYFVKQGRVSLSAALRWAAVVALLGPVWAVVYVLAAHTAGSPAQPQSGATAMFALACAACVLHGQLRTLVLAEAASRTFSIITAAPQVLILLLAVVWAESGQGGVMLSFGLALSFLLPSAAAWRVLLSSQAARTANIESVSRAGLFRYGAAAWLAAMLAAASVVIIQRGVEQSIGAAALGLFAMALTLSQVPLMPVNYATPLLFRHWMASPRSRSLQGPYLLLIGAMLVMAAVAQLAAAWRPDLWLGSRYLGIGDLLTLLLLGAAGDATSRVAGARVSAAGQPWRIVMAEALRCAVLIAALVVASGQASVFVFGLYWVCASWASAAFIAFMAVKRPAEARS